MAGQPLDGTQLAVDDVATEATRRVQIGTRPFQSMAAQVLWHAAAACINAALEHRAQHLA